LEPISHNDAAALDSSRRHFLASAFWAKFKSAHGWRPFFFKTDFQQPFLSVLARRVKGFTIAYIPMQGIENVGVERTDARTAADSLRDLTDALAPFLPSRTIFARFDPRIDFESLEELAEWKQAFLRYAKKRGVFFAPGDVQPPDTVLLDLARPSGASLSENDLLSAMKSKWRYNIGLAGKKGVSVRRTARDSLERDIDIFYRLYLETAKRDKIAIHSREYYETLLKTDADVRLYIAEHESEPIACIVTLFFNGRATYLYGASASVKRNLMAPYLLQWQAIVDAKYAGCIEYDFYGIPPTDDETHSMHGLYRFKTGFGGRIVHRPGSIDAPLSPLYSFYRAAETVRSFYYKRVRKFLGARKNRR
jgi:lipid II:glycine glycyltransferase (peptidoglycan interpeptide bridge formation enzyme)